MADLLATIHGLLTHPAPPVAIDTASFQAADSYVEPYDGRRDPRARGAFQVIATAYCNSSLLTVPCPNETNDLGKLPDLFTAWEPAHTQRFVGRPSFDDGTERRLQRRLLKRFRTYANEHASEIAQWVSLQFTASIRDQYFSRAEADDVKHVEDTIAPAFRAGKFATLCAALEKEIAESRLAADVPSEYAGYRPPLLQLAVMYVFSVYVRGWQYARSISEHPDQPRYEHLWLRREALVDAEIPSTRKKRRPEPVFPWGTLLAGVFDLDHPLIPPSRARAIELLHAVQRAAPTILGTVAAATTERDLVLANELLKVGIIPQYKDRQDRKRLLATATWATRLLSVKAPGASLAAEVVYANLGKPVVRLVDARFALTFQRSRFWDLFDDPGMRTTLVEWERMRAEAQRDLLRATA